MSAPRVRGLVAHATAEYPTMLVECQIGVLMLRRAGPALWTRQMPGLQIKTRPA